MKLGTQYYFVYTIVLKWLELKLRSYVVLIYFYSYSFRYSSTIHLFRYEIVPEIETSDNEHHSESDKDYDPKMEKDIIDDDHDSVTKSMTTHTLDTRKWLKTPHHIPRR